MRKLAASGLIVLGLVLAAYGFTGGVSAATHSADLTITFNILTAADLTITGSPLDLGNVTPGIPKASDVDAVNVNVKSNKTYSLDYSATNFTVGSDTVEISHLFWSTNDGTDYTQFGSSGNIASTATRTTGVGTDYSFTYQINILDDYSHAAVDDYSATVTYTVTN